MYRVGGRAHAHGITFESDIGRVTACDGKPDKATVFSSRIRRFKAAVQKIPVLRVFPALGKSGGVLFLLLVALLLAEVFVPQAVEFEVFVPDMLFYGLLAGIAVTALLVAVLTRDRLRRLLRYHGAEHMAINTYRSGRPLTVENISQADRATPSCGSVLALIFFVIAVPLMFLPYGDYFTILAFGVAFELSVLARRVKWLRWLLRFGMAAQRKIWTRQPDPAQIELAQRGLSTLISLTDEHINKA